MTEVLSNAGRSFLRAFAISLLVYLPGVLAMTNLDGIKATGVAALAASITAGLRALQDFIPSLQFSGPYGDYVGSFVRAFVGQMVVLTIGILEAPDLSITSSAIVGVLVGAGTAGIVALQKKF